MPETFIIIDGSSLVHRAFYALPPLTTGNGQYTNAVYGFTTMLVKLLGELKPDYMVVAFDKGKITFRNDVYADYKAQRKPTPRELSEQFPLTKEVLAALGITQLEEAGYEGDDIIGTLAAKAGKAGHEVIIVTGDRDALQLISSHTKVMLTKKGISDMDTFDTDAFLAKYNVTPQQQIDLKGLMGDTSDNIPGVPGVGEKTAIKLIAEYGSIENVLENIENISGKKLQENLRNNKELALLSKQLATIKCDMNIDFAKYDFRIHPNLETMKELFAKFEFKSLLARVHSIFPGYEQEQEVEAEALPQLDEITDAVEIAGLITQIRKIGILEFYPLIIGDLPNLHMSGIAIILEGEIKYISSETTGWQELLTLFPDASIMKVTHDAKKMYHACASMGTILGGLVFDTILAAYLLEPTANDYSLAILREKYLGKFSTIQWQKIHHEPIFTVWAIEVIHEIYPILKQGLIDNELIHLFNEIELPLIEVLSVVENHGIKVDREYLQIMSVEIGAKIELLLTKIYQYAGETFNVNSPKQLGVILFEKLHLPAMKKTKTGYSTDAEVLEKLAGQHAIVDTILEYRMLAKLKSTYLDGMADLVSRATDRIHTTFNQMVTATGRLSSSEPNLQNIPIRTEMGKKIREIFIPGAGYDYLMSADYSQIELRVLADMSGDANLIESFAKEQDVHTRTAAEVFEVPMEEVTSELRSRAKAVNFGIVYGISDYGLSRDTGVSRKEASQYIENYFTKYNGVKTFMDRAVSEAHQQGYVTTLLGRRRYLPDINSKNFNQRSFAERTAMNTPIQGTAADIIKKAMVDVYRALKKEKLQSRILLQVHDELVLEVPSDEVEQVSRIVKEAMEKSLILKVPLVVDVKIGKNWADAK
ncbi:DNA polymerase I [Pelosinus propionicus]|uniref:DNA polymerase I n=1 Tax=Pelosinus propionicus DSM 13327 TaxID=1123291 RepID=A0A1I4MX05_9FIRM|nr:DNA polymerase I [Pelosinus propionicus]SFM07523.1 DNA polymerase I [Pelosinus propionicus DSM 13327]